VARRHAHIVDRGGLRAVTGCSLTLLVALGALAAAAPARAGPPELTAFAGVRTGFEFEDGAIQVDATIVAKGLGMAPANFMELLRQGRITSLCEKGIDADSGRHRLTFFAGNRRFRLVVEESGVIVQRSTIDFGDRPIPMSARRPGG